MNINMENKERWQLHHTDGELNMKQMTDLNL